MLEVAVKILPIVGLFIAGVVLCRGGVFDRRRGEQLLRLVVNVALPTLILGTITRIDLQPALFLLPVSAALTIAVTWPVALGVGTLLNLERATLGAFVTGAMIMNMAFEYPFALLAWGHDGFAHLALFDFGNGVVVLTLVYAQACWFGGNRRRGRDVVLEVLRFPPFWALVAALAINVGHVPVPGSVLDAFQWIGSALVLLVPVALGIYFDARLIRSTALLVGIGLRAGLGLALGWLWVTIFGLEGLVRAIVFMGVVAPVGFNTLVFAAREHLDREFAASMASVSMLLALIYLPVVIYWLS